MPKNKAPPVKGKSGKLNPTLTAIRDKKIKKLGNLHPKSRKASQAHKELLHMDKKVFHIATKDLKYKTELLQMSWFQRATWMDQKPVYTLEELKELSNEYTERHDDDIANAYENSKVLITSGVKRLAPTSKAGQYETLRLHEKIASSLAHELQVDLNHVRGEQELIEQGKLSVPDLTNPKVVRAVSEWKTGNVDQMKNIKKTLVGMPEESTMDDDGPRAGAEAEEEAGMDFPGET